MKTSVTMCIECSFLVILLLVGCGGGGGGGGGSGDANRPPIADAGVDKTVSTGAAVILDGSKSNDPDGDALVYHWAITAKPLGSRLTLSSPTSPSISVTPDMAGIYSFSLTVGDGTTESTVDTMTVTSISDAVRVKTEKLVGKWNLNFTIISDFTFSYVLDTVLLDRNSQGGYAITGKYGSTTTVLADYWPRDGNYTLLHVYDYAGAIDNAFYVFYTDGDVILAGSCQYMVEKATGNFSSCHDLSGYKTFDGFAAARLSANDHNQVGELEEEGLDISQLRGTEEEGQPLDSSAVVDGAIVQNYQEALSHTLQPSSSMVGQ